MREAGKGSSAARETATITDMSKHSKLSTTGQIALAFAVLFVMAGMGIAFWYSFDNLSQAGAAHGWNPPYLLPLMVDSGIPVYVIIDQLIIALGWRSLLPRAAAWGFAVLTVFLNGAVSADPSSLWRITHAAMPAAWILGVEVLRLVWRALRKDPAARPDSIPPGRWVANPFTAFLLWRRKHLLGIGPWPLMSAFEDARAYLRDTVAAVRARKPGIPVPLSVRQAMRSGRFPGEVRQAIEDGLKKGGAARWEQQIDTWLARRLGLPKTISDTISNDLQQAPSATPGITPGEATRVPPERTAEGTPEHTPRKASRGTRQRVPETAVRRVCRLGGRKATDEDVRAAIREMFAGGQPVTKYRVAADLPLGEKRASRLFDEVAAERPTLAAVD